MAKKRSDKRNRNNLDAVNQDGILKKREVRRCCVKLRKLQNSELATLLGQRNDINNTQITVPVSGKITVPAPYKLVKCVVHLKNLSLNGCHENGTKIIQNNEKMCRIRKFKVRIKRLSSLELSKAKWFNIEGSVKDLQNAPILTQDLTTKSGGCQEQLNLECGTTCTAAQSTTAYLSQDSTRSTANRKVHAKSKTKSMVTLRKKEKFFRGHKGALAQSKTTKKNTTRVLKNVFEFLSQTSESDNENVDPAADVIKKMINSGKCRVATLKKGSGKPVTKASLQKKKKLRPIGRRKQCSINEIPESSKNYVTANMDRAVTTTGQMSRICEVKVNEIEVDLDGPESLLHDNNHSDDMQTNKTLANDAFSNSVGAELIEQAKAVKNVKVDYNRLLESLLHNNNHSDDMQTNKTLANDAFSNSVGAELIEQAKAVENVKADYHRLLDVAKQFVSTPINSKKTFTTNSRTPALNITKLSPINIPSEIIRDKQMTSSPWRVTDDSRLPNTFVFGRNTSNLPSFSSDFIRKTPTKVKSNIQNPTKNQTLLGGLDEDTLQTNNGTLLPVLNNDAPFNESNAENITPPAIIRNENASNEPISKNNDKENYVHSPNPRRTLQKRSPLKPINIIEIITLFPRKNNTEEQQKTQSDVVPAPMENLTTVSKHNSPKKDNLFGFQDFITDEETAERDQVMNQTLNTSDTNEFPLHLKLKKLRELRPPDEKLPLPCKIPMRYAYDINADQPKQRKINQMLCSTMINNESISINNTRKSSVEELFNDPETTFNNQNPKTYLDRIKRKRNIDNLEDEDLYPQPCTSAEILKRKAKKKCTRKEAGEEARLNEFATSFNAMCSEVENFKLIIEKE